MMTPALHKLQKDWRRGLWKELRLLRLVTFARAQRTVDVASARLLVSLHARPAVVLLIRSARTLRNKI